MPSRTASRADLQLPLALTFFTVPAALLQAIARAAASALLLLLGSATFVHAEMFKLGHVRPLSQVWHQVLEKIAADPHKALSGKPKVTVRPLQKLGNQAQMSQLM